MLPMIAYLSFLLFLLFLLAGMTIYTTFLIYSSIKGAPYVPTRQKKILRILENAHLKKGGLFVELGCGDGRVVRLAVKKYYVRGVGIDINPLLVIWSRILSRGRATFIRQNVYDTDFSKADYLYIFLMPKMVEKLLPKLKKSIRNGTLIISHGFKIDGLKKYLAKTVRDLPFSTFYYRLK